MFSKLKAWIAEGKLIREANDFNNDEEKTHYYRFWKCPACGKITEGKDHEYRWLSGLNFPGCCNQMKRYGHRCFSESQFSLDSDFTRMCLLDIRPMQSEDDRTQL